MNPNEEEHRYLIEILAKLVEVLDIDELSCLAFHTGVSISDFYETPEEPYLQEKISAEDYFYGQWKQKQIDMEPEMTQ